MEATKIAYDNTIDKIIPITDIIRIKLPEGANPKGSTIRFLEMMSNPDFVKYNMIYSAYRFATNLLIFVLLYLFLAKFTNNKWLIIFGLIYTSIILGNSVNDSDFTLHTYINCVLYLLGALIIISRKNDWYIVVLTIIGAFNRETSILIPFLYFTTNINWSVWKENNLFTNLLSIVKSKHFLITIISGICFIVISVAVRIYYGYEEQTQWKVPAGIPMLKLNLLSAISIKSYFEMIGVFSVIPFIILYKFKQTSEILKIWFFSLVPIWFIAHLSLVVAYQSRLFLVPTLIIFLPMLLEIISKESKHLKVQATS